MRKHFTLIEMMVVVGIIGVLAGLVIPAVASARTTARKTACISNQGQTMKIISQSMNDEKQQFISGIEVTKNDVFKDNGTLKDNAKPSWAVYLNTKNRLLNLKACRCPSLKYTTADEQANASDLSAWADALQQVYGVVNTEKAAAGAKSLNGFDFRSTALLMYKKNSEYVQVSPGSMMIGACAVTKNDPDNAYTLLKINKGTGDSNASIAKLHGDESNIFLLDGHAESIGKGALGTRYYPCYANSDKEAKQLSDTYWLDVDDI